MVRQRGIHQQQPERRRKLGHKGRRERLKSGGQSGRNVFPPGLVVRFCSLPTGLIHFGPYEVSVAQEFKILFRFVQQGFQQQWTRSVIGQIPIGEFGHGGGCDIGGE